MIATANPTLTLKRCLSVFVFIGPFVGFLATLALFVVLRSGGPGELLAGVALGAMGFPLVYALGFFPMLIAGVAYWALRCASPAFVMATGVGALLGGLLGALPVTFFFSLSQVAENACEVWLYCIPGAVAAITCAIICRKQAQVADVVPSA
jgi:hypothetical protein